jgi:hypothetical protein
VVGRVKGQAAHKDKEAAMETETGPETERQVVVAVANAEAGTGGDETTRRND